MKYESKTFSVSVGDNQSYRDGWERIWGKKDKLEMPPEIDAPRLIEEEPAEVEVKQHPIPKKKKVTSEKAKKPKKQKARPNKK